MSLFQSDEDKVKTWLKLTVKLPEYISNFIENGFDIMEVVQQMKIDDLNAIDIAKLGHKKRILIYIKKLNNISSINNQYTVSNISPSNQNIIVNTTDPMIQSYEHKTDINNPPPHKKRKLNTQVISLLSDDEHSQNINVISDSTQVTQDIKNGNISSNSKMPSLIPDISTNNSLQLNSNEHRDRVQNENKPLQRKTKRIHVRTSNNNTNNNGNKITDTEIINAGYNLKGNEAVKYYTNVIKEHKHLEGEALFRIANAFEVENDYKNAIIYYQKRLNGNFKWQSSLNVHHLALNLLKQNNLIATSQIIDLFIQSWQLSAIKKYQQKYVDDKILQLIGSAKSAVELGQIFKDKHNGDNNQSLIWYKRAMNLLEKTNIIFLCKCNQNKIINSSNILNDNAMNANVINRKRINWNNKILKQHIFLAETMLYYYQKCLVEKFRKIDFVEDVKLDNYEVEQTQLLANQKCFIEYNENKQRFECFTDYLKKELDSVFEMLHTHMANNYGSNMGTDVAKADVYVNYGAYICDVLRNYQYAAYWYHKAILYHKSEIIYWNLAEAYEKMKRFDESERYYALAQNIKKSIK